MRRGAAKAAMRIPRRRAAPANGGYPGLAQRYDLASVHYDAGTALDPKNAELVPLGHDAH